jgi:hypothetical protein
MHINEVRKGGRNAEELARLAIGTSRHGNATMVMHGGFHLGFGLYEMGV